MSNTINITACDNELILIAYQGQTSFEICHILSGFSNPVNVTLDINARSFIGGVTIDGVISNLDCTVPVSLASGDYTLCAIGINWAPGTAQFAFTLNGTPYELPLGASYPAGVIWTSQPIPFTV